jgi:hypothetical protein
MFLYIALAVILSVLFRQTFYALADWDDRRTCHCCQNKIPAMFLYERDLDKELCYKHREAYHRITRLEREVLDAPAQQEERRSQQIAIDVRRASYDMIQQSEALYKRRLERESRYKRRPVTIGEAEYEEVRDGNGDLVGVYMTKVPPARPMAIANPERFSK